MTRARKMFLLGMIVTYAIAPPLRAETYPDRFVWIFGWNLSRDSDVAEITKVLETGAGMGSTVR